MFKSPFLLDGIEVGLDGMEKDGVKRAPCVCEVSGWDDTKLPSCLVGWLRIGRDERKVKQRERENLYVSPKHQQPRCFLISLYIAFFCLLLLLLSRISKIPFSYVYNQLSVFSSLLACTCKRKTKLDWLIIY